MPIRNLTDISCGLDLGLIYSLSYSYIPQEGIKISIFFVTQNGIYNKLNLLPATKTNIQIGTAYFSMYPIAYEIQMSGDGRRVMRVDFIDDTFRLDNYFIALKDRGCGEGIYQLGTPVDNRTTEQKRNDALDKDAEIIREFTQFQDVEYKFDDFLSVLRQRFDITISANYDKTFSKQYTGTFRDVLNNWCSFYNMSYFFENGILNIFDPTFLSINLPKQELNCLEYNYSESIENTYNKTAFSYFQKDGGQFNLNDTSDTENVLSFTSLYPIGGELNLKALQNLPDIHQVVAAQYGKEFWFLYNYFKGTASIECGWTPITSSDISNPNLRQSILSLLKSGSGGSAKIAKINQKLFDQKYEMYFNYGQKIAGRYYLSDARFDLLTDSLAQWFNITNVSIVDFASDFAKDYQVTLQYFFNNQTIGIPAIIPETVINDYFDGIKYLGNRMVFIDDKFNPSESLPVIDPNIISQINNFYKQIFVGIEGSSSFDISSLGTETYVVYFDSNFNQPILDIFNSIDGSDGLTGIFESRFEKINLNGLNKQDLSKLRAQEKDGNDIKIIKNSGVSITGNTGIIRAINNGSNVVYYDKYSTCASAASYSNGLRRKFVQQNISYDIPITFSYESKAKNSYKINRDLKNINDLINSNLLLTVAQPRDFTTKKVTMTFNYFFDVPENFLSNGLVSLDLQIGDAGVSASYTYSNEVLQVPHSDAQGNVSESFIEKLESVIKNSWIRTYNPDQVISKQ